MNRTLIAIATAGLLASGAAVAGQTNMYAAEANHQGLVGVQYGYDRSDERSANINEREARIKDRIQRGMHDGSLTDREARRLYRELADIEGKERAFRSDGRLDGRETAELNRDLDRLASNLQDQRHDEQRRY
jgi:CRISPR/Cas system-associated endoribonuclease Cas2